VVRELQFRITGELKSSYMRLSNPSKESILVVVSILIGILWGVFGFLPVAAGSSSNSPMLILFFPLLIVGSISDLFGLGGAGFNYLGLPVFIISTYILIKGILFFRSKFKQS
jgi:hypothetical protein